MERVLIPRSMVCGLQSGGIVGLKIDNFLMVFIKFLRFYFHIHDNAKSQH